MPSFTPAELALTPLSGPPLALLLDNQGLAQDEFRAAIALIRVAESSFTLVTYFFFGFYGAPSLGVFWLLPAVQRVSVGLGVMLHQLGRVERAVSDAVSAAIGGFIIGSAWQRLLLLRKSQVASP
jgi:hypothetical protein